MSLMSGKSNHSHKNMARRPRGDEKIKMDGKRFGYFPQQFTWRGRRYDVRAVERCWTVSRRRLGNKVDRLCFRVRCRAVNTAGGPSTSKGDVLERTLNLYQDLNTNTWHLEGVVSRR